MPRYQLDASWERKIPSIREKGTVSSLAYRDGRGKRKGKVQTYAAT